MLVKRFFSLASSSDKSVYLKFTARHTDTVKKDLDDIVKKYEPKDVRLVKKDENLSVKKFRKSLAYADFETKEAALKCATELNGIKRNGFEVKAFVSKLSNTDNQIYLVRNLPRNLEFGKFKKLLTDFTAWKVFLPKKNKTEIRGFGYFTAPAKDSNKILKDLSTRNLGLGKLAVTVWKKKILFSYL
ncbi:hypothetical protein HDU92_007245 [Lobulomyces angularis]|nr:hypothetical protein HDU92_007245 [Lobulomyces angularis]